MMPTEPIEPRSPVSERSAAPRLRPMKGGGPFVVPAVIAGGTVVILAIVGALVWRAEANVNQVALSSAPKPVSAVFAYDKTFRETRKYVGTLRAWIEASIGPQFVSAYVDTVLVRPGAVVRRGEVLATLDCRNASASSLAVEAEARAIDARQQAIAHESARVQTLLAGGFASPNEAEQKSAETEAEKAQLAAERAKLASTTLEVSDCVLRAPFDGEVATRSVDPGAFVRPGTSLVSVIDRNTVRMTFDVPETDFDFVPPGTLVSIRIDAIGKTVSGAISRRSPSADPDTRTAHVEVDLVDPERSIPVNTTGEARIEIGSPIHATAIPLVAASISGSKAEVFVVDGEVARRKAFEVKGEQGSDVFVDISLRAGTRVVTEGRAALEDGDRVQAEDVGETAARRSSSAGPKVGAEAQP